MKSALPASTFLPSTRAVIPRPAIILKFSAFGRAPSQLSAIAMPRGCSESFSADAARRWISSFVNSPLRLTTSVTRGFPTVRVPVLSKATLLIFDSRSSASPERMIMPYRAAFPIPARIAVGVARMKAQGQNTTSTVTALMNSPVKIQVATAQANTVATSRVAHLSARVTTGALFSSASSASRIILCSAESPLSRSALIRNVPNRLTVPLLTVSPAPLSTGMLSPVMTDWSTVVSPSVIVPSAGIVSPASTRIISPTRISSTGTSHSSPSRITRAFCGLRRMSFSMLSRALPEV